MSFAEEWFNPGAFFILLRETLEAAVIVAILLRFMDKMNHQAMKKQGGSHPPPYKPRTAR